MSQEPADGASAAAREAVRLFASPPAIRKGRFLALLLLVNWAVMGIYVLGQGIRSLVGGLAFVLGLFALIGGLTYLRAARAAATLPLIEIDEERLRYRRFAATEPSSLELDQVTAIVDRRRDAITVASRDGERADIPWLALSESDRERLVAELAPRVRH
ncbi:MAG TPA: hypothetical protein VMT85_14415 [Thermoanaerobaculia bacterium]|nr:hypothetical protein [Thermoanaerobaculia bacterium]